MQNETSYKKGLMAEFLAKMLLRIKGYSILKERFKTPLGEIDIIAKRGGQLVFVEVKARGNILSGMQAISNNQKDRIITASRFFMSQNPKMINMNIRFDVIIVSGYLHIKHIQNAWDDF